VYVATDLMLGCLGDARLSDPQLNVARRTAIRISSALPLAASSAAMSPLNRRSRVFGARLRRTSPQSGCATRASTPSSIRSSVIRPRASALLHRSWIS